MPVLNPSFDPARTRRRHRDPLAAAVLAAVGAAARSSHPVRHGIGRARARPRSPLHVHAPFPRAHIQGTPYLGGGYGSDEPGIGLPEVSHAIAGAVTALLRSRTATPAPTFTGSRAGTEQVAGYKPTFGQGGLDQLSLALLPVGAAGDIARIISLASKAPRVAAGFTPAGRAALIARAALRGERGLNTVGRVATAGRAVEASRAARGAVTAAERAAAEGSPLATAQATGRAIARGIGARATIPELRFAAARASDRAIRSVTNPILPAAATTPGDIGTSTRRFFTNEAGALIHHPGQTLSTTARVVESIPAVALSVPVTAAEAVSSGSTAPIQGLAQQQLDYLNQVYAVSQPGGEQVAASDVGLIPLLTIGLGGAGVRGVLKRGATEDAIAASLPGDLQRLRDTALDESRPRPERQAAETQFIDRMQEEGRRVAKAARTREAERVALGRRTAEGQFTREVGGSYTAKSLPSRLGRLYRKKVGDITEGHLVSTLAAEGLYDVSPGFARTEIERRLANLRDPTREIPASAADQRLVYQTALDHPEVLSDPLLHEAARQLSEVARGRAHERGLEAGLQGPKPGDEARRLARLAEAEGILKPHERVHPELEGRVQIKGRAGKHADQAVRASAKRLLRRARSLKRQADALRKMGPEGEALAVNLDRAAANGVAKAGERLSVVDRFKTADKLEMEAARVEAGQVEGDAAQLRARATELRRRGLEGEAARHQQFIDEVQARIEEKGYSQPAYVAEHDVSRQFDPRSAVPYRSRSPLKEKFRRSVLAEQGRVATDPATLLHSLWESRAAMATKTIRRNFLSERLVEVNGSRFRTEAEWNKLIREGRVPKGGKKIRLSEFSSALQPEAVLKETGDLAPSLRAEYRSAQLRAKATGGGDVMGYIDSAEAYKELQAQHAPLGEMLRKARVVARVQNAMMIATSPAWFAFQLAASPLQALYAYTPHELVKGAKDEVRAYKSATPFEQQSFDDLFGSTSSSAVTVQTHDLADVQRFSAGLDLAFRSPVGRAVHSAGRYIGRTGGPLIHANRIYEAKLRRVTGMAEVNRALGKVAPGKVRAWAESTVRLTETVRKQVEALDKVPPEARAAYLADHPEFAREVEAGLKRTMGSWDAFTTRERAATALIPFYGFARFSYRWLTVLLPKTPARAGILLNMAQANAAAFQAIIGGKPDNFTDYGTVVTYPNGEPTFAFNLARAMPGGNAIIEAIGQPKESPIATAAAPFEPLFGALGTAAAKETPFGTPSQVPFLEQTAKNVLGLNPLTRGIGKGWDQTDASKLFEAVANSPTSLLPHPIVNLGRTQRLAHLAHLYDVAYDPGNPEGSAARSEIASMMAQYGIGQASGGYTSSGSGYSTSGYGGSGY